MKRTLWFLPLVLAYATALWWCVELWTLDGGYFAHGPLVPLVMVAVFWHRRADWSRRPAAVDWRGWLLLGPALLVHLCGAALTIDSLSAASMVLAVPGAAWLLLGRQRLRGLWPALWLVAFAVPTSMYVSDRLAFELKEVAVRGGVWLANATGLAVERTGATLQVPDQLLRLDVADPCGGLRSLLAMVTLVYCLAFFTGPRNWLRRAVLLAAAAPLAVTVNIVRIAAICWVARLWDVGFASGIGHDVLNALAWILDLGLVLLLDACLVRRLGQSAAGPAPVELPAGAPARAGRHVAALWLCALPLLLLSVYRPHGESTGRAARLPDALADYAQLHLHALSDRQLELLGTDDATWRTYEGPDGAALFVTGVFHTSNWKSVHPPHICLRGSDMEVLEDGHVDWRGGAAGSVPGGESQPAPAPARSYGRLLMRSNRDGRPYLSLYVYGARELCTGSYLDFFLYHAPRALFRASNDGFLLRVETWVEGPGGLAAAETRCQRLLAALVRRAQGLLQ